MRRKNGDLTAVCKSVLIVGPCWLAMCPLVVCSNGLKSIINDRFSFLVRVNCPFGPEIYRLCVKLLNHKMS